MVDIELDSCIREIVDSNLDEQMRSMLKRIFSLQIHINSHGEVPLYSYTKELRILCLLHLYNKAYVANWNSGCPYIQVP